MIFKTRCKTPLNPKIAIKYLISKKWKNGKKPEYTPPISPLEEAQEKSKQAEQKVLEILQKCKEVCANI